MLETAPRNTGDQAAYGYKQLPGLGQGRGPELKSLVYGGIGVALGILVGTFAAENYQNRSVPVAATAPVLISSPVSPPANPPAISTVKAPPAHDNAATPSASKLSALKPSPATNPSTARIVSAVNKQSSARKLSARKRRWIRHVSHSRRRLRAVRKHTIATQIADSAPPARPLLRVVPFVFTVEGDDTEANFDASTGMIETYEGETFLVGGAQNKSESTLLQDFPADIHYRCDQSGACTLILASHVAVEAQRKNR